MPAKSMLRNIYWHNGDLHFAVGLLYKCNPGYGFLQTLVTIHSESVYSREIRGRISIQMGCM